MLIVFNQIGWTDGWEEERKAERRGVGATGGGGGGATKSISLVQAPALAVPLPLTSAIYTS